MYIPILILLLGIGHSEALLWQKLTCPFEPKNESTLRVWCRQSSADCCTGLPFSQDVHSVHRDKLRVTEDVHSFTVEVLELSQGTGVYWCGMLSGNNTFTKLAEGYFYSSPVSYIWSFSRWILLLLLPMVTAIVYVYSIKIRRFS